MSCQFQRITPKQLATLVGLCFAMSSQTAISNETIDPNAVRVLLSPAAETILVSQMPGQVAQLNAELGKKVKKGDKLVIFNCAEPDARLRMSKAELAAAKETFKTKTDLRQLDAAGEIEVSLAKADVDRTTAAVALNQAQLSYCNVTAPFNGYVVKRYVKPFQGVSAGEPLIELISSGPLKIRLNLPSAMLANLSIGSPFQVRINETGGTYAAKISAINARIDAVAQTIELEGRLNEALPELLAGMTGIAIFSPQTSVTSPKN